MSNFNGYAAIVSDEPLPGVPSYRLYGPFATPDEALKAVEPIKETGRFTTGYLPLRSPDTLLNEIR